MKKFNYLLLLLLNATSLFGYTIVCENYEVDYNSNYYNGQTCTEINEYPSNFVVQLDSSLDYDEINLLLINMSEPFDSILLNVPLENGIGEVDYTFTTIVEFPDFGYTIESLELGNCSSNLDISGLNFFKLPQIVQPEIKLFQNTSIFNQKLNNYPLNFPFYSQKGGFITFNHLDTTFNYSPPLDYIGPDKFYYLTNEISNDGFAYQKLNRVFIDVNHPNFYFEIIDYTYESYIDISALLYSDNDYEEIMFTINDDDPIITYISIIDGIGYLALSIPLDQSIFYPYIEIVSLQDSSLFDMGFIHQPFGSYGEFLENTIYCYELDTISMTTDSVTIAIQQQFSHIKYCETINPISITNEVIYDTENEISILTLPINEPSCFELFSFQYNDLTILPIWHYPTEPTPLNCSVLLEGAYDQNGLMTSGYDDLNLLPLMQPYNQSPWNYEGIETLTVSSPNIIDWVLVELRAGTPSLNERNTITVETKAGILLDNGQIASPSNINESIVFDKAIQGENYHVCIRHRNHLDILSNMSFTTNEGLNFDFINDVNSAFGLEQLKQLDNGYYGLHTGDFNGDGIIQVTDYDLWFANPAVVNSYSAIDANLDGIIQVTDYDAWFANKAKIGSKEISY